MILYFYTFYKIKIKMFKQIWKSISFVNTKKSLVNKYIQINTLQHIKKI